MKPLVLLVAMVLSSTAVAQHKDPTCSQTSKMRVYSDVRYSQETGDVGGFDLALPRSALGTAKLYIFEGALLGPPVTLELKGYGKRFVAAGVWELELKDEKGTPFIEKHAVRVEGEHDGKSLRGTITIKGWGEPDRLLKLKRQSDLWVCKYGPIV